MLVYFMKTGLGSLAPNMFEYVSFHGNERRDGKDPYRPSYLGNRSRKSLLLQRDGTDIPKMFKPGQLIVSQELRQKFSTTPHVEFQEVVFEKLVRLDPRDAKLDWQSKFGVLEADEIIERLPDCPELHQGCGNFFELIVHRVGDIRDKVPSGDVVAVTPNDYDEESLISSAMFKEYPVLWELGHFFREDVFEIVKPYVVSPFFAVVECELP